jgi:AbrB family looped-hinge helix DNA binding protein
MSNASTITSKWQVTIPEVVREKISLKIGQRLAWEVEDGKIVGRRIRTIRELAGCLKSKDARGQDSGGDFGRAALDRHDRISRQKP